MDEQDVQDNQRSLGESGRKDPSYSFYRWGPMGLARKIKRFTVNS